MAQINKIQIGSTTYDVGVNLANSSGVLSIDKGGTNARNALDALANLGGTPKTQAIPYIVGPATDTTAGTWTGTCEDITAYVDGLTIIYVPKVAGASTTTLNINGLGAKTCYQTNSSKLGTHFSVNTPILLTYIGGTWKRADYDSNTNTYMRVYRQTSGYDGDYPILVSRTTLGSIGTAGTNGSYTSVYGVIGQDGTYTPTINPHTGALKAYSFTGIGSGLTSLNASNISSGTIAEARLPKKYLPTSGGTMTGTLVIDNGAGYDYSFIRFNAANGDTIDAELRYNSPYFSDDILMSRSNFNFYQYSYSSSSTPGALTRTNYYETYALPQTAAGLTSSKFYNILTSKSAVTVAQGGTGATTAATALVNLGASKAIKSITRSGTTFTYTCLDGTTGTFTQQDNNTIYSAATTSAAGLMSAADKTKLDGIATGANKYSLPTASSSTLGGVKIGTGISISSGVISNSGVRSVSTGATNGTISINVNGATTNVAVKGLSNPDWENNNSSDLVYIKNRTHYKTTNRTLEGTVQVVFSTSGVKSTTLLSGSKDWSDFGKDEPFEAIDISSTGTFEYYIAYSKNYGYYMNGWSTSGEDVTVVFEVYAISYTYSKLDNNYLNTIDIAHGGTGATDAATARSNLGAAAASHNHQYLTGWADTRDATTTPNDYNSTLKVVGIKTPSASGISSSNGGSYSTLVGIRGWSDSSGGNTHELAFCGNGNLYHRHGSTTTWEAWKQIWIEGDSITGAVWNDYAEYRESNCEEFGRVLMENGDDTLSITTDRLQPFAGISSDTWGFCQGETEKAKTPIAVAGRVLVYPYRDRNEYKPGDVVCAAPNGTVDIMTREEIINYPDRIVGTVSCVPIYETWGRGDRDPVKVDGRIWIKVH